MAKEYKDLVVGLDIGTSKIMLVVAEVTTEGQLKLAGLGVAPSNGLKRGVVVNIDATVQSITQALKEAEEMAECRIARVSTGITGSHIRGISSVSAPVFGPDGELVFAISAIGNQMTFDATLEGPIAKELRLLARRLSGFLGSKVP